MTPLGLEPEASRLASRLWWTVPAVALLLLLTLALLFGQPEERRIGSSYDATHGGFRAAYLLLEELGYPVARSRQPTGGTIRWVLYPRAGLEQAKVVENWVRQGGRLLLADDAAEFARQLGQQVRVTRAEEEPYPEPAQGGGITRFAGGRDSVTGPDGLGQIWASADGHPVITRYALGQGEIWLVNRPAFLTNRLISQADNAILLCRLADAMRAPGGGRIEFDEFFHGLHERPGVFELLLRPPALWITLQGLLFVALLLWHYVPRFGPVLPVRAGRRRSQEEFLDAMASLLERKGAYADAYQSARQELLLTIERDLGLPPATPAEVVLDEACRRRPIRREVLQPIVTEAERAPISGPAALVHALLQLESARDEFFQRRHHRAPV